jgi:hypothetical protein
MFFMKDSAIHTSGLYLSRPDPCRKSTPHLFALSSTNYYAQALDDQVEHPSVSAPRERSPLPK